MTQPPGDVPTAPRRSRSVSEWSEGLSQVIGGEVNRHRTRRDQTIAGLSRATEELSHPISRMAISNLEAGKRESITVAELLVLADALEVPPVMLIAPAGFVEDVTPLPRLGPVPVIEALRWLRGDSTIDYPPTQDLELVAALQAFLRADDLADELAYWLSIREGENDRDRVQQEVSRIRRDLRVKRADIRRLGLEPPPVSTAFGDVDTPRPNEPARGLSYVIGEEPAE